MKKLLFVMASAATLTIGVPAARAQVAVEAGPGGVGVEVGHDAEWRRHHRHWRDSYAKDCRVEKTQVTTPSGRTITKTVRHCD